MQKIGTSQSDKGQREGEKIMIITVKKGIPEEEVKKLVHTFEERGFQVMILREQIIIF